MSVRLTFGNTFQRLICKVAGELTLHSDRQTQICPVIREPPRRIQLDSLAALLPLLLPMIPFLLMDARRAVDDTDDDERKEVVVVDRSDDGNQEAHDRKVEEDDEDTGHKPSSGTQRPISSG